MMSHQSASIVKVRVFAFILLAVQIGLAFAFVYLSQFDLTVVLPFSDSSSYLMIYELYAILAILGFGLILSYASNSAGAGLASTLLATGLTVQLQWLCLALWQWCFYGFNRQNLVSMRLNVFVMQSLTSLMIALCFLVGRLGIVETLTVIIIFNFGWAFNLLFEKYLWTDKWTNKIQIVDSNGVNYIYVFASVFGLIVSLFLNKKAGSQKNPQVVRLYGIVGIIGTGFAFAAFPFTGWNAVTIFGLYENSINVYFALTASVVMTYWSSAAFGGFMIGVRETIVGVLGGGVMIAGISSYINNIGACIAVGAFAGIVSGFWLRRVYPFINQKNCVDHVGLMGPVLINSIIGGLGVSPILFQVYKALGITVTQLNIAIIDSNASLYCLAITGSAVMSGVGFGVITGVICYLLRNPKDDFETYKLISLNYGLYVQPPIVQIQPYYMPSANQLNKVNHDF